MWGKGKFDKTQVISYVGNFKEKKIVDYLTSLKFTLLKWFVIGGCHIVDQGYKSLFCSKSLKSTSIDNSLINIISEWSYFCWGFWVLEHYAVETRDEYIAFSDLYVFFDIVEDHFFVLEVSFYWKAFFWKIEEDHGVSSGYDYALVVDLHHLGLLAKQLLLFSKFEDFN